MAPDKENHARFIVANWDLAALVSWQEFLTQGRGAIVVYVDAEVPEMPGLTPFPGAIPAVYVSEGMAARIWPETGWPLPYIEIMIREYDPISQVVFVFINDEGDISAYRSMLLGRLSPRDAYLSRSN